jgi:hypothetical protein
MLSTSARSGVAEAPDIWSNNPDIVELAMDYFKMKWAKAKPLKESKTQRFRLEKEKTPQTVTIGFLRVFFFKYSSFL